jgi:hypothetical protein
MAGGGLAGEGQPSLCRLAQPLTFSLWPRHVKELGTRIATFGSKLDEDCIYIGAEREIRDSHQSPVPWLRCCLSAPWIASTLIVRIVHVSSSNEGARVSYSNNYLHTEWRTQV